MNFFCNACHHEWTNATISDAPVAVVIASLRAVTCPICKTSKHIVVRAEELIVVST